MEHKKVNRKKDNITKQEYVKKKKIYIYINHESATFPLSLNTVKEGLSSRSTDEEFFQQQGIRGELLTQETTEKASVGLSAEFPEEMAPQKQLELWKCRHT